MPELPEVETTLRGISPHLQDACVTAVIIRQKQLRWPIPTALETYLQQQKVLKLARRGKYLLLSFSSGTLIIHLGMSGRLSVLTQPQVANKHDHVDLQFSNHITLRYTDPRRFGAILFTPDDPEQHPLLKNIGVEPLTPQFNGKYLAKKLQRRKTAIKTCLLDSHIVAGIGNIYATEALFIAGINPSKPACHIQEEKLKQLVSAVKTVLKAAIVKGGTTLKDFLGSNGKPGYFRLALKAYGKAATPCPQCKTILLGIRINNRSTVYCSHCQK